MPLDTAMREEWHDTRFTGDHFEWGKLAGGGDNGNSAPFTVFVRTPVEFTGGFLNELQLADGGLVECLRGLDVTHGDDRLDRGFANPLGFLRNRNFICFIINNRKESFNLLI